MKRTIIIGDLHGCYDEAIDLLDACQATESDRVIFTGDLVDRGPKIRECVELAMKHECVLGNHEDRHLEYEDFLSKTGNLPPHMPKTHVETRQCLDERHYEYMRSLPLYIRLPEHNAVVVHAGVFPGREIEEQARRHLLHIQAIKPYEFHDAGPVLNERSIWASRIPDDDPGWAFWTHFWTGDDTVVFGHTVTSEPLVTANAIGLDGACVFGHELRALILPERKIVSVKSRNPSEESLTSMKHVIHGSVRTY